MAALDSELSKKFSATSSHSRVDPAFKNGIEQSLKLLQKSIKTNKDEIEKVLAASWQKDVENMMSVATVKAVFSDFSTAASKVLETLKLWSHLQPVKEKELSAAAQNLLNFQQAKGKRFLFASKILLSTKEQEFYVENNRWRF